MDERTEYILKLIKFHARTKLTITFLCYFTIFAGVLIYVFYSLYHNENKKIISQLKDKSALKKSEKVMINPRIEFQHNDNKIYHIEAKKALHKGESDVTLYEVRVNSDIGSIKAGKLEIDDNGDHLFFSDNPVLILNENEQ